MKKLLGKKNYNVYESRLRAKLKFTEEDKEVIVTSFFHLRNYL